MVFSWSSKALGQRTADNMFSGRISVSSVVFFSTSCNEHSGYLQGTSLPDVGWVEWDNFLPEIHQYPFDLVRKWEVRSREIPDRHEFMSSEAKCLWLGWGRGHLSCLHTLLERPPIWETECVGCLTYVLAVGQQDPSVSTRMLSHVIQLPG